ncbi:hypothetical protein [Bradyrhizobium sp. LMG 9283]|uniref:hypothetical protein n=1 Tax=Bradyrhizobium sp. LMG 9283 TaxID=592064 RepID=UPI00388F3B11
MFSQHLSPELCLIAAASVGIGAEADSSSKATLALQAIGSMPAAGEYWRSFSSYAADFNFVSAALEAPERMTCSVQFPLVVTCSCEEPVMPSKDEM